MSVKEVCHVGSRGVIFTFHDDIRVYLIQTDKKWFLCDTHLGPQSMEGIKQYISQHVNKKEIIVFNSHSDWDHIWGNCVFQDGIIIGHDSCRKRMAEIGQFDLVRLKEYHAGTIQLALPNVTFTDRLIFAEDEIEFIYAPGHTIDSAICFDQKDSVLFVGDLVEHPIPYLDFNDLEVYIKTLDFIKNFPAKIKIAAHSGIISNDLIEHNRTYIQDILKGNVIDPALYQECPRVHTFNINNRLFLKYEKLVREKLGENFNYTLFRSNFHELDQLDNGKLQEDLEDYFLQL